MKGYHALVLHAHLPFVRHPEHTVFLEEDWLYEAIAETYLPMLEAFDRLVDDGVRFRMTMTMSPTLVAMLTDDLLMGRFVKRLDTLCELAEKEVHRTSSDPSFEPLARFYRDRFGHARYLFVERYRRNLIGAFSRLQDEGVLEIITSGATHGFLPLLRTQPEAVRAQILVGAQEYRRHFGREAPGIWLPECGYYPGLETMLAEAGLRYFLVDTHGILNAEPRPRHGAYAPLYTNVGVAAFGRDRESSFQVWSSQSGYPGDPVYREFYRDIGYDLDLDYVGPYVQATGARKNTGIKYHRITGDVPLEHKQPYDPAVARERADVHAGNFMFNRERQIEHLASELGRPPVVVSPYDAELFGHWWYEGPDFLERYLRKATFEQDVYRLATPLDYLGDLPEQQVATPSMSSWGDGGHSSVWLNESNDWIYPHLHTAAERMIELARTRVSARGHEKRALNQAAREPLLAQSSDWAFIMHSGTMVDYAVRRTKEHLGNFSRLHDELVRGTVDLNHLRTLEQRHNLFPELDHRVYAPVER